MNRAEYEIQNFDALNNAIDDEHQKSFYKIKLQKSNVFKRYMLYGSLFLFALSLLVLISGFIYWLINDRPNNLLTKNEYITNNYQLEKNISQLEKIIERNKEYDQNNSEQKSNGNISNQIIKEEFYLYKFMDFEMSNNILLEVITGQVFDPDKIDFPRSQFCYTKIFNNQGQEVRVNLSDKIGLNSITNLDYSNSYKDLLKLSDFNQAQQYCKFRSF